MSARNLNSTQNSRPLMELKRSDFRYDREPVIRDFSLKIFPGEFVGVIGPNGSGKSTLLKLLGGILPGAKSSVYFDGLDLSIQKRKTLAQSIAWVPQENPMVFPFKVSEVVLMGRHPYLSALAFESEEDCQIARRAMDLTHTSQFANRLFNEISSGEKQRVMIAAAIAQEPRAMLLDEPTSALDLKFQMEILNILKIMNRDQGATIVMALHDLHLASKFCDRLILIKNGTLVVEGSPATVLQKEILKDVYEIDVNIIRDETDGSFLISPEAQDLNS